MGGLTELLTDYTLRNVALGSALLGITGGVIGGFTMLRRQSLLGDAVAHAALPGVCLAFLLTGTKAPLWLLLGGGLSGWLGALAVLAVLRQTRLSEDAALGTVLSGFFGFGITLLTYIQGGDNANQAGLDKFLFGQAATIVAADVTTMAVLAAVGLGTVALLFKEFKLLSFDPTYAATLGYPTGRLGALLTSLAVVAVMIGLQTVGVVLMAAMLIAPPAAARQWTDHLGHMLGLSALFGAAAGVSGAVISAGTANLPTGPVIIVVASVLLLVSLLFAPRRGLVWAGLAHRRRAQALRRHTRATPEAQP
ncbi:iron chelate uptake ABC transporter family permease subunit [Deinococcus deserti]|uniref:Putative Mn2+/Zn2+ ABC transporter, permease component n=1 Tax=Deinococcus deserti (strain DSM 17065 / CIP 109153 / LMG 22923 / VCD115) TaxID=546414 RepID=C1D314_DEIDV|nr:iron chelate uptake ABC transporter family permease subunit [Deinococcus deserti]ACO47803.1 putative Mn2+/Zn2+ ABC transporter, permease component [Deinococcus deserti VCD115]